MAETPKTLLLNRQNANRLLAVAVLPARPHYSATILSLFTVRNLPPRGSRNPSEVYRNPLEAFRIDEVRKLEEISKSQNQLCSRCFVKREKVLNSDRFLKIHNADVERLEEKQSQRPCSLQLLRPVVSTAAKKNLRACKPLGNSSLEAAQHHSQTLPVVWFRP